MVRVKNLKKTYGSFTAVDDVSFDIAQGEIFGFLGPNGAGKTSTINMLTGLSRPTSGDITIAGIDMGKHPKKVQALMGVVPDESNLYNELDGFGNLCFAASLYGMKKAEREQRARELLAQFGLTDAAGRLFGVYSKGMRRKLTIAAGIIHSPRILFLDEPTTGIDVESARGIRDFIADLKKRGTTVFITTHYIEDAERICDRIAFIAGGKIVASGSVTELMHSVTSGYTIQLVADGDMGEHIAELQARFEGCTAILSGDRSLSLLFKERRPLLPVIEFFSERGVAVYEAKELRPTLEDIFVKVTGIEATTLKKGEGARHSE